MKKKLSLLIAGTVFSLLCAFNLEHSVTKNTISSLSLNIISQNAIAGDGGEEWVLMVSSPPSIDCGGTGTLKCEAP